MFLHSLIVFNIGYKHCSVFISVGATNNASTKACRAWVAGCRFIPALYVYYALCCVRDYCFAMKSLSLGIVRASASSALAYSRLCSGNPFLRRGGGCGRAAGGRRAKKIGAESPTAPRACEGRGNAPTPIILPV
ncbi:MAG: hypothetical protein LBQ31_10545 [Bacteroidales bacterium]|nr:hypothetical protein [Bacteroidales bacterium]